MSHRLWPSTSTPANHQGADTDDAPYAADGWQQVDSRQDHPHVSEIAGAFFENAGDSLLKLAAFFGWSSRNRGLRLEIPVDLTPI